jgi:serine phosphatase RsbU (regulator of sigma subunit)
VTESLNESGEEFGTERLIDLAKLHRGLPALEMVRTMCHSIQQFRSPDSVQDDLTLSIVKYDTAVAH